MTLSARLLAAAAWLAAAVTLALPAMRSDASFNAVSENRGNAVVADAPSNYVRLYSQSTDPAFLTGYGVKRMSSPSAPAARGQDATLAVALGGYKNQGATTVSRVFTLQAPNSLPTGVSGNLEVRASLTADPVTGKQPITAVSFSNVNGTGAATFATLPAGAKRQVNLTVRTQPNSAFPGNNTLHTSTITLTVRHSGYGGSFLSYRIPVSVWDGNGAGP
jgi:hypothetical protein